MSNEKVQKQDSTQEALQVFGTSAGFEQAQRMAKMLASSKLVPQQFQNNEPDCVLALEMSQRIGASVFSVLQNMYVVYGKPAFSAQFLISCLNASGRFTPLRYRMTGDVGQDDYGCIAWAKDGDGELLESPEVTIAMAKAEGWYEKNGSKWKTMPALMLRYRAATLFVRLYAPEITMGMLTDHEVIDITPGVTEHPQPTGDNADEKNNGTSLHERLNSGKSTESTQSQSEQSSGESDQAPAETHEDTNSAKSDTKEEEQNENSADKKQTATTGSQLGFHAALGLLGVNEDELKAFLKARGNPSWKETPAPFKQKIIEEPEQVAQDIREQQQTTQGTSQ